MDYEKKYKEALERAREYHSVDIDNTMDIKARGIMEYLFPELAGSESEQIRKELLAHCINRRDGKQVCVDASDYRRWADWLEKQGEQKPVWSEDDELSLYDTKEAIINYWHGQSQEDLLEWLKSLKLRCTWKPSDEQIGVIESLINNRPCKRKHLDSLYNDLKKLREDKVWGK